MKMKVVDVIRKTSDEQIANIIGAVIVRHTDGISYEEAVKMDFQNTLKELQREIEIDYKPTNADRIRAMSDEELAMNMMCPNENGLGEIECDKSDSCNCYECILKWLQSEVEKC